MNNLFITYQLTEEGEHKDELEKAVASMGNSTQLHATCWYVNSEHDTAKAIKYLSGFLSKEDILIVVDTSNEKSVWFNLDEKRAQRITQNWIM